MKRIITVIFLISIIILSYCGKNPNKENGERPENVRIDEQKIANVHFTLTKRLEALPIGYPRIAVSDYQDKLIVYGLSTKKEGSGLVARMYNKNLDLINEKTFHHGQGPGDASAFNVFSFTQNNILMCENSNCRVSIFDNNWNLIDIKKHKTMMDSFQIYENGTFFVQGVFHWDEKWDYYSFRLGSIPSFKTKTFFTFGPFKLDNGKKVILGGFSEFSWLYKDKEIFVLDCGNYRILKFDNSGRKLKDIKFIVEKVKTDHSEDKDCFIGNGMQQFTKRYRFSDTVDPAAASMIPLSKGFVVVRRHNFLTDCNGMVDGDYFSYELKHMGKVKVPGFNAVFKIHGGRRNESFKYNKG
ncbi:MAG: hypothetical protein ACM3SY_19180, partial [Candidatus Omnitrophota bacterium]